MNISNTEKAMYDWIDLIVGESLPVSVIKKKTYRRFKNDETNFSQEKLKETLYKLVELAETRIGFQMKKASRGTIMHDRWGKNGVHYVAIFACFMKEVSEYKKK